MGSFIVSPIERQHASRRTKQSGPEFGSANRDPPMPMDKAERSARVLSEQTRGRDHPGLLAIVAPLAAYPNTPQS
jgi:hypothetical protein